jgi:hypothetical protein
MQCNAMQCNAMQCNAMQCNAMQCNALIHNNIIKVMHVGYISFDLILAENTKRAGVLSSETM